MYIDFPDISPVIFSIGPFSFRWYAMAYLAGIVAAWLLTKRNIAKYNLGITNEQLTIWFSIQHSALFSGEESDMSSVTETATFGSTLRKLLPYGMGECLFTAELPGLFWDCFALREDTRSRS